MLSHFDQFYTVAQQHLTWEDSLQHVLSVRPSRLSVYYSPAVYFASQPEFGCQCEGIPMPHGAATIDMRVLLQLFLKQGSGYWSMNGRAKLTPTHPRVGLTPGAPGLAQESAKETQPTISIFNTSPSICRRHVTFQGPLILKHNR